MLYENVVTDKCIIYACDAVYGSPSEQAKHLLTIKSAAKYVDTHGFLLKLPTAIDLVYTITIHIKTNDCLMYDATIAIEKYNI